MKRFLGLISATGLALPLPAQADDGAVAAGIAGGLLGGLVLGSALTPRPVYEAAPVYVTPPPPRCYWTRGPAYFDDWNGVWVRERIRVCD
jgi:hypothetical protein